MSICDDFDEDEDDSWDAHKRHRIAFVGKQLLTLDSRLFSTDNMADAINLYPRSRSSYRALREQLLLPSRNTILNYFGRLGLPGGFEECEKTLQNVFSTLDENQKTCFISFDEIHIKPGLHYQGKYVLGNALNKETPCPVTTILAAMINPSFSAPPFVARLIPVHNMTADFFYGEIMSLVNSVHIAGGFVYALMSDNLSVNQKVFKLCQVVHAT